MSDLGYGLFEHELGSVGVGSNYVRLGSKFVSMFDLCILFLLWHLI